MKTRLILIALLVLSISTIANAQATRTWVSGVGDDANPCSRTAPCKTFAGAISKTARNGIINVLDPGGFGTVTITKSITIDGLPFMAGVLAAGTNGINVNVTDFVNDPDAVVILRNLDIEGIGSGLIGVSISSAKKVIVENCRIFGFRSGTARGIHMNTSVANLQLLVKGCTITNNGQQGMGLTGAGAGAAVVHVTDTTISMNGASAIDLIANAKATVTRCELTQNGSAGVFTEAATTDADVAYTAFEHNIIAASALNGSAIRLYNSVLTHNNTSVAGNVLSHQNNAVVNNNTNTLPGGIGQQ
jgi:hypothetical protein